MKIMITGAAGQLGRDLSTQCARRGDDGDDGDVVVAFDRSLLDITDRAAVAEAVEHARPDVIVNCAAWTAVDACESDPALALAINATAVGSIAEAAAAVDAHLVQVSTDYVFDGTKAGAYEVDDATNPQSAYGISKLAGEAAAGPDATIVRTSWVCSAHGGNMVATVLRVAESHPTLRFVSDQRGRPTFTTDLAEAIRNLAAERAGGVFHVANHGEVSWFDFVQEIMRTAGHDPARVEPITTAELDPPRPAPRPANSVLSTTSYESLGLGPLRHFSEPLAEVVPSYLGK